MKVETCEVTIKDTNPKQVIQAVGKLSNVSPKCGIEKSPYSTTDDSVVYSIFDQDKVFPDIQVMHKKVIPSNTYQIILSEIATRKIAGEGNFDEEAFKTRLLNLIEKNRERSLSYRLRNYLGNIKSSIFRSTA